MPIDFGPLTATLNQAKLTSSNPALYQFCKNLIGTLQDVAALVNNEDALAELRTLLNESRLIIFIEPDTATAPQVRILDSDLSFSTGVVYKDFAGNAAANNITLTGTVDGVVNPVINTNFGVFRVYRSQVDGNFHQW